MVQRGRYSQGLRVQQAELVGAVALQRLIPLDLRFRVF